MAPGYVLIAECDPYQLARFREMGPLVPGWETVLVRDGLDARGTLRRRGAPELLVTDLNLPMADGISVLRELRKLSQGARAVVHSVFPGLRAAALKLKECFAIEHVLEHSPSVEDLRALVSGGPAPAAAEALKSDQESRRLAVLEAMGLRGDDPPERELTEILEKVARETSMPVALVSLVYRDIQFFKAHVGLSGPLLEDRGTPREWSFCQHVATADRPSPLVVPDAREHPTFMASPLVQQGLVTSYLGAPILSTSGEVLGSLCVTDTKPTEFSPAQVERMQTMARRVGGELELIAQRRQDERAQAWGAGSKVGLPIKALASIFSTLEAAVAISDAQRRVIYANPALFHHFGLKKEEVVGHPRSQMVRLIAERTRLKELFIRQFEACEGPFTAREEFDLLEPRSHHYRWVSKPLQLAEGLGQICYFVDLSAQGEVDKAA